MYVEFPSCPYVWLAVFRTLWTCPWNLISINRSSHHVIPSSPLIEVFQSLEIFPPQLEKVEAHRLSSPSTLLTRLFDERKFMLTDAHSSLNELSWPIVFFRIRETGWCKFLHPHWNLKSLNDTVWGTRWCSCLRYCATSWKVAGLIPSSVIGISHWHNPSGRTLALGLTQPLTEMSTKYVSWEVKAAVA